MKGQHSAAAVLFLFEYSVAVASGQISGETFNPISTETNGVHLYSATVSSSYYSNGYGLGLTGLIQDYSSHAPIATVQGSAVLGWAKRGTKSNISATYSPSYMQTFRASSYTSMNHSFSMSANRTLKTKWTLSGSANGIMSDFQQLMFGQSQYAMLSTIPSTFDELVGAILTGRSTNIALTQAVNTAPVISSPEAAFLYGGRLFSTSASLSLTFARSSRSTITSFVDGNRTQNLRTSGSDLTGNTSPRYVVPNTSSVNVGLAWSYSVTPRTTFGVDVSSTRVVSSFQDSYASRANLSIGRTLSTHWFVQGTVGAGTITPIRQTLNPTRGVQPQFGGSIGYKLYAHTFIGSYSRSIADRYGLGANSSETSAGGWTWKRPGKGVSLSANFGYSRLLSPALARSRSWTAQSSVSRALSEHLVASAGYSHAQYPGTVFAVSPMVEQNGVTLSLSWSPSPRR